MRHEGPAFLENLAGELNFHTSADYLFETRESGSAVSVSIHGLSGPKHPLGEVVHLLAFDEFAARDLIDANLHLLLKPFVVARQPGHGFLYKILGTPSPFFAARS
jgi:hypothetical protein